MIAQPDELRQVSQEVNQPIELRLQQLLVFLEKNQDNDDGMQLDAIALGINKDVTEVYEDLVTLHINNFVFQLPGYRFITANRMSEIRPPLEKTDAELTS